MNKENYGSCGACQRLINAKIVLVADMVWAVKNGCEPQLIPTEDVGKIGGLTIIPAVNLAEVWRELPDGVKMETMKNGETAITIGVGRETRITTVPTDTLIDLLIWVRKQEEVQG